MNPREPRPALGIPPPPSHISARAKQAWEYVSGVLGRMQIGAESDALGVEGLCQCYAELIEARERLAERGGPTYESVNPATGQKMFRAYPEVALISDLDRRFRGWLASFGLTPADRSKVSSTGDEKDGNPFAEFGS